VVLSTLYFCCPARQDSNSTRVARPKLQALKKIKLFSLTLVRSVVAQQASYVNYSEVSFNGGKAV